MVIHRIVMSVRLDALAFSIATPFQSTALSFVNNSFTTFSVRSLTRAAHRPFIGW
jgi:hypothetical protein